MENNKEFSLQEYMKEFGEQKNKMSMISLSINAKERKIAALREEYQKLAVESQKFGWKKITVGFEDFKNAVQKYFKHKGMVFEIELPKIPASKDRRMSKEGVLYEMKARCLDEMKIRDYTRFDCEEMEYPIVLSAVQADGKTLQDHISIKKVEYAGKPYYQLFVDENVLLFNFRFDECLSYNKNTLMFAKDFKGAALKYLIEKEQAQDNENVGEIE